MLLFWSDNINFGIKFTSSSLLLNLLRADLKHCQCPSPLISNTNHLVYWLDTASFMNFLGLLFQPMQQFAIKDVCWEILFNEFPILALNVTLGQSSCDLRVYGLRPTCLHVDFSLRKTVNPNLPLVLRLMCMWYPVRSSLPLVYECVCKRVKSALMCLSPLGDQLNRSSPFWCPGRHWTFPKLHTNRIIFVRRFCHHLTTILLLFIFDL